MLWNQYRLAIVCTSTLALYSSHSERAVDPTRARPAVGVTYGAAGAAAAPGWARVERVYPGEARPNGALAGAALGRKEAAPFCLYLTFDDGPSAGSPLVNALARENGLPINVFLIGRNVCLTARSRELFQEYKANPLIEIGNHSYTHAERHYEHYFKQPDSVLADFNRSRDSLQPGNRLTRLPGRNFFRIDSLSRNDGNNGREAADRLAANGYSVFGWDLEWRREASRGFERHTAREMLDIVSMMLSRHRTFLPGQLILLLHEQELRDTAFTRQLEDFIRLAKADGHYRFGRLSDWTPGDGSSAER